MHLNELSKKDRAVIKKVNASSELRHRLNSFGVMRGVEIEVKAFSLKKQTIEIEVNHSHIALRFEEAQKIEVEKI